jgi:predicted transcriptional regulator
MMLKTTIKLISDDKLYYISHFTDFRGRVYSRSIASPIINKMIRPLIVIDENNGYSEVELLSTTAYAKLNEKFNEFYENFDQITNFKIALLT